MAQIEEHKALKVGTQLESKKGNYTIESILGMGGFGITYKATRIVHEDNIPHTHRYAIKEFFRADICMRAEDGSVTVNSLQQENYERMRKAFHKEAKLLSKLPDHEGLIKVNERFDANNTSYYVMQFLEHSLEQKVQNSSNKRLPENEALDIIRKIGDAVAVLHSNNRLHLDIKPANIMFRGTEPCLIDFGNSRAYNNEGELIDTDTTIQCSAGYAPQEQYVGINDFSPSADIYALGATLLYILSGKHPLPANEISDSYIDEVLPADITDTTKATIKKSLATNPRGRYPSIDVFLSSLNPTDGGTETELFDYPGSKPRLRKKSGSSMKIIRYAVIAVAAVLIACGIFWGANRVITSYSSADNIPADTLTADSVATDTTETDTLIMTPDPKPTPGPDTPIVKPIPPKPEPQPNPKPEPKPSNGPHDLGWGTWNGSISDGNPVGRGKIVVKEEKNIGDITVKKGDVIENCTMDGKRVSTGTVRHKDGSIEKIQ